MYQPKIRAVSASIALLMACMSAHAGYQSPDGNFMLSGFGTLGLSKTTTDDVLFNYPGQGGGAGKSWSADPDSKIALQGTYKFGKSVSGTVQVMSKFLPDGQYDPGIDWAFVKWQAMPELSLRAGRMGAPFFMISDFRNVGYANNTVRPNLDVYGQVPTDKMEGIDATYQHNFESTTVNATFFAGKAQDDYTSALRKGSMELGPSNFEMPRLRGVNLTAETDFGLTVRGGYLQSKFNLKSDSIDAMMAAANSLKTMGGFAAVMGQNYEDMVNANAAVNNKDVSFIGFGATYDQDNWILSAEYTKRKSDNFVADTTGWYANVGYRIGKFTPFVGLSRITVDDYNVNHTPGAPTTGNSTVDSFINANYAAANPTATESLTQQLAGSLQAFMNVESLAQKTYTLGTRWDVAPNVALKAQWDQIHKPAGHWGLFFTPDPTTQAAQSFFNERRKVNVLTLSMDVVF